jgi:hypothetical protein
MFCTKITITTFANSIHVVCIYNMYLDVIVIYNTIVLYVQTSGIFVSYCQWDVAFYGKLEPNMETTV